MNLIIEGVDCAGKSTLVKELKNRFKYDVIILGHQDNQSQFRRYLRAYADHEQMIYERSHISEDVYTKLFGRDVPFSKRESVLLDEITSQTCLLIHAHPHLEDAKQRYIQRSGVYQQIKLDELEKCIELFEDRLESYRGPKIIYQSKNWQDLETTVEKVHAIIKGSS